MSASEDDAGDLFGLWSDDEPRRMDAESDDAGSDLCDAWSAEDAPDDREQMHVDVVEVAAEVSLLSRRGFLLKYFPFYLQAPTASME